MKRIVAFLATLFFAAFAFAGGVVPCTGANDGPAIQASLNAGGATHMDGSINDCSAPGVTITLSEPSGVGNQRGETTLSGGPLRAAGIVINGARNAAIRSVEGYFSGVGLRIVNAIQVTLADNYFSTDGDCLSFDSIAAVWMYGKNQCNATPAAATATGLRIGNTAQGFEAVDVSGLLVEGYYSCARIGGTGNNVNMWFRGLKCDRPSTFGIIINPYSTAGVRNIEFIDAWINCAPYALAINVAETTGRADRINFSSGIVLGNQNALPTIWGDTSRVTVNFSNVMTGPCEAG